MKITKYIQKHKCEFCVIVIKKKILFILESTIIDSFCEALSLSIVFVKSTSILFSGMLATSVFVPRLRNSSFGTAHSICRDRPIKRYCYQITINEK